MGLFRFFAYFFATSSILYCSKIEIVAGDADLDPLEECLREFDAEIVGLGGISLLGTMDSVSSSSYPWWQPWSGTNQALQQDTRHCTSSTVDAILKSKSNSWDLSQRTIFNQCRSVSSQNLQFFFFFFLKGSIP